MSHQPTAVQETSLLGSWTMQL